MRTPLTTSIFGATKPRLPTTSTVARFRAFTMADGFLASLLKKAGEGDEEAKQILIDIKRKLDSLDDLPKKRSKTEQVVPPSEDRVTEPKSSVIAANRKDSDLFHCNECGKKFSKRRIYNQHVKDHVSRFPCQQCEAVFKRKHDLSRHVASKHGPVPFHPCADCLLKENTF